MYFIYCDELGNKIINIKIKQLGLKIYSLTENQRDYIKQEYESIYKKRRNISESLVNSNDGTILFDYKKRRELEKDDSLINIINMIRQEKIRPTFHKDIDKFLSHILILEVDSKILGKYIDCQDFRIFVHQFIDFHYVFDTTINNKKRTNDISIPYQMKKSYKEKNNPEFKDLSTEIIIKYFFDFYNENSYGCFYANKSFEHYLLRISKFINGISSEELFKFIEIMEIFFSNARLSQNNILNDTLIIESLLVKKESNNIEKEFVLKTGIIYKDSKLKKYYSNEDLSVLLHYLYDMRSSIIHGSMEKIFDCYNKFSQKIKSIPCSKFENVSKMQKKILILKFTERMSYDFVKLVLIYWISNNDKISFLRNN